MPQIIESINSHSPTILLFTFLILSLIHRIILTNLIIIHRTLLNLLLSCLFWLAIYYLHNLIGIAGIFVIVLDYCSFDMYSCNLFLIYNCIYLYRCIYVCLPLINGWMCRFIIMISYLLNIYGNTFWCVVDGYCILSW